MRLLAMSIAVRSMALGMPCKLGDKSCIADDSIEGRSMLHHSSHARQQTLESALAPPAPADSPGSDARDSPHEDVVEDLPPEKEGKAQEEAMFEPKEAESSYATEDPAWLSEVEEEKAKLEADSITAAQFTLRESIPKNEMEENGSVLKAGAQVMLQADEEPDFDSDDGDSSMDAEAKADELTTMPRVMGAEEKMVQADEEANFDSDNGDASAQAEAGVRSEEITPTVDMEDPVHTTPTAGMEDPMLKGENEAMLQADEEADLDPDDMYALVAAEAKANEAAEVKSGERITSARMEDPVLKDEKKAMMPADKEADFNSDNGDVLSKAKSKADDAAEVKSEETTAAADMEMKSQPEEATLEPKAQLQAEVVARRFNATNVSATP